MREKEISLLIERPLKMVQQQFLLCYKYNDTVLSELIFQYLTCSNCELILGKLCVNLLIIAELLFFLKSPFLR